jgi:hypothetical protein
LPGSIFINTGSDYWKGLTAVHQIRVAVHEYFHAVQVDSIGLKNRRPYTAPVPTKHRVPARTGWSRAVPST